MPSGYLWGLNNFFGPLINAPKHRLWRARLKRFCWNSWNISKEFLYRALRWAFSQMSAVLVFTFVSRLFCVILWCRVENCSCVVWLRSFFSVLRNLDDAMFWGLGREWRKCCFMLAPWDLRSLPLMWWISPSLRRSCFEEALLTVAHKQQNQYRNSSH